MATKPLLTQCSVGEQKYCSTSTTLTAAVLCLSKVKLDRFIILPKIHFSVFFHVLNNCFHFFFCLFLDESHLSIYNKEKYTSSLNKNRTTRQSISCADHNVPIWIPAEDLLQIYFLKTVYDTSDLLNTFGRIIDDMLH